MSYASRTIVSIDKSQAQIKNVLLGYGASSFAFGETADTAMVQFQMKNKWIKFKMSIPTAGSRDPKTKIVLSKDRAAQVTRSRWRALLLVIKAKLECIDSGITTLEQEFMAHIVLSDGTTVGERVLPEIETTYKTGNMPALTWNLGRENGT